MDNAVPAILDTSVFIARESGRPLKHTLIPIGAGVSVVTIAELRHAVIVADTIDVRARRLETLERALGVEALSIDEDVATKWAFLRAATRSLSQARVNDLWIAATALVWGVPVVTQDDGLTRLRAVGGPPVIRV